MPYYRTLPALGLLVPGAAHAATFSVIGSAPGPAQIGAASGKLLYGTMQWNDGSGVLFALSTDGKTYTALHVFAGGTDGSGAESRLAQDSSRNIYGASQMGGTTNGGTIWEYSASGAFSVLHTFGIGTDATNPLQGPVLAPDGALFGTASSGAIGGSGDLYKLKTTGHYKVLHDFMSGNDGHCPFSGVAIGKGGAIYGTTIGRGYGGNPTGSVWRYTQKAGAVTIYVFQDGNDGEWPDQAPAVDQGGNVYGTTHIQNGANFPGAVWSLTPNGKSAVLYNFTGSTDGYAPNSPLLLDTNGTLYGTTASGGQYNDGTVFGITPSGAFTMIHAFTGGNDGATPTGNLAADKNGVIYGGVTSGQVFKIVP